MLELWSTVYTAIDNSDDHTKSNKDDSSSAQNGAMNLFSLGDEGGYPHCPGTSTPNRALEIPCHRCGLDDHRHTQCTYHTKQERILVCSDWIYGEFGFWDGVDVNSALGHQIQTPGQSGKYTSAVTESDCVRKAPASVSAVTEPL